MAHTRHRTMTRATAIKTLLEYRLESWDADDTQKVIREGRQGLHEMSNRELAGLWEDWFEQPITVTGKEPKAHVQIEQSVLDALVTALTNLTACVSMRGPVGTTAYLIAPDRMQKAKAALALVKKSPLESESDFQYDAEDRKAWTQIKRRVGTRQKATPMNAWTPCPDTEHEWNIRVDPTDSSELRYTEECQKCFAVREPQ